MNLEYAEILPPLRIVVVNPLTPAAHYAIIRMLSGAVFGTNQVIELTLVVFSNEVKQAKVLVREMDRCAFVGYKFIKISTTLPSIADADVFIFETTFVNPNIFDFKNIDSLENFDSLYLLLKVAHNLVMTNNEEDDNESKAKQIKRKPIFVTDGLVAMDILYTFSTNVPSDCFFCPTPIAAMARSLLGDYLKILSNKFRNIHIFGANDQEFYFEFEMPLLTDDVTVRDTCGWDIVSEEKMASFGLEYTQFSPSWLKKEFIEKVKSVSAKNLYGPIFKSARYKKVLRALWTACTTNFHVPYHRTMGVISDGSLDTFKGLPYVLPLSFCRGDRKVNTAFENNIYVQAEIKKCNKITQEHHNKLIPICKQFYETHLRGRLDNDNSPADLISDISFSL